MYDYILAINNEDRYCYYRIPERTVDKGELTDVLKAEGTWPLTLRFDYETVRYLRDKLGYAIVVESTTPIISKSYPKLFI